MPSRSVNVSPETLDRDLPQVDLYDDLVIYDSIIKLSVDVG